MTSVTVVVPMTIRRRGGRKQIIGPDGVPVTQGSDGVEETRGDPVLVKALARAFRWRRLLEEGRYGSIRELAKAEGVDRNYIGRLLNLTLLAPEVVEAVLEGRQAFDAHAARAGTSFPDAWSAQRAWLVGLDREPRDHKALRQYVTLLPQRLGNEGLGCFSPAAPVA